MKITSHAGVLLGELVFYPSPQRAPLKTPAWEASVKTAISVINERHATGLEFGVRVLN